MSEASNKGFIVEPHLFPHTEVLIVLLVWLLLNVRSLGHFFSQNPIIHRCFQFSADNFKSSHFIQGRLMLDVFSKSYSTHHSLKYLR